MQPVLDEYAKLNEIYINAVRRKAPEDSLDFLKEKATAIREKYTPYDKQTDKVDYEFFVKHPHSYVTAYMMRFHLSEWSLDTLQMFYDKMNETICCNTFRHIARYPFYSIRTPVSTYVSKYLSSIGQ